tara:strand:+ start:1780 stop:1998 length:219 start_codon:yes stop_codon:yes gene_type:complete
LQFLLTGIKYEGEEDKMNTYKVTLRTSEFKNIQVPAGTKVTIELQAESEKDVRYQLGSLSVNEVEELTDGIA